MPAARLRSLLTSRCTLFAAPAPGRGATQNGHNCDSAQPPTKNVGPVLQAGLTEVLVTGKPMRWISVSDRPMAIGAKPLD